jgi:hypothetical protein
VNIDISLGTNANIVNEIKLAITIINRSWTGWSKDGTKIPLTATSGVRLLHNVLIIPEARQSHAGEYTCQSKNRLGQAKMVVNLQVNAHVTADIQPSRQVRQAEILRKTS